MTNFTPTCRLCGGPHWVGQCEHFGSDEIPAPHPPEPPRRPKAAQEAAQAPEGRPLEAFTDEEIKAEFKRRFFALRDAKRPKDEPHRRVYMRNYMRKHRKAT